MRHTIVIADNDPDIYRPLTEHLTGESYEPIHVENFVEAKREIGRRNPRLVIAGTGLPDAPGLDFARWILIHPARPALILLEGRGDPIDRTIGLEMGADDCMSKPIFARELLARIHSVLRRLNRDEGGMLAAPAKAKSVTAQGYDINLISRQVILPHGAIAAMSWTEAKILASLLENRGMPVTRDILSRHALGRAWSPDDRSLDQHIAALRRKLESSPSTKPLIVTVRHVGYVIEADQ